MRRRPSHVSSLAAISVVVLALLLAGCTEGERAGPASELDEPAYRQAQSLMKSGRRQEALASYLKVIEKRGDGAPESHLEAGLLFLQHIGDPLAAIYHFKKYLALRPNSQQAPLVRQRVDAAIREFARTLPAQPLTGQQDRIDLLAKLDRLQRENDELKQLLADLKAGRALASLEPVAAGVGEDAAPALTLDASAIPTVRTRPEVRTAAPGRAPRSLAVPGGAAPAGATTKAPPATPARAARSHTVKSGDTLYKLAQQYYGDRARWKEIYTANRQVMKSETDLRIGAVLTIP